MTFDEYWKTLVDPFYYWQNWIYYLAFWIVAVIPHSGIFTKAGRSWFAAFVPFYNIYVFLKISGKPGWWWVLFIVPILNLILSIIMLYNLSKSFGKGGGFTVGLVLLNWVFSLILWMGSAQYLGPYGTRDKHEVPAPYQGPNASTPGY